jgi:electron transport complex protein RnfG
VSDLVQIEGAPRPKADPAVITRIAVNLAIVCALGAVVLGAVFLGTERVARAARLDGERRAVSALLALPAGARVLEVSQFLAPDRGEVVYRAREYGDEESRPREIVFTFAGDLVSSGTAKSASAPKTLAPVGRIFIASANGTLAGFVIEGGSRGYKNRIRFFVALDSAFVVQGVRVVEHEEDPGLGATGWFQAQYVGRSADQVASLDVTRDPMPEDWRAALDLVAGEGVPAWRAKHANLLAREHAKPVYAVTGATISSRALTAGVRTTVDHFRRRWALLAPQLGGRP